MTVAEVRGIVKKFGGKVDRADSEVAKAKAAVDGSPDNDDANEELQLAIEEQTQHKSNMELIQRLSSDFEDFVGNKNYSRLASLHRDLVNILQDPQYEGIHDGISDLEVEVGDFLRADLDDFITEIIQANDLDRIELGFKTIEEIQAMLDTPVGSEYEGVPVTQQWHDLLNKHQAEAAISGDQTNAGSSFADSLAMAQLSDGNMGGMVIQNFYNSGDGEKGESISPNFTMPTPGHGEFLTTFSALNLATL